MLTLIYLIIILGLLILVHELWHFITAKKSNVHIYEFALGMGPQIFKRTGKDGVVYSIRAFPIGGFVQMAGEVDEDDKDIKKDRFMCNRPWYQRLAVLLAGVIMNFILALVLLFISALIWGSVKSTPTISKVEKDYPMALAGVIAGDEIMEINGYETKTWDKANVVLNLKDKDGIYEFKIKKTDGSIKNYSITPKLLKNEDGEEQKVFGLSISSVREKGFVNAIKYSFKKFGDIVYSMTFVIAKLITGELSLKALSGPVGMYSLVGDTVKYGLENVIYLVALLSINLGFLNVLPFPAFDGGRVLFLVIEKIKGSRVDTKIEGIIHTVGFALLMILMVYITFQDILKFF